MSVEEVDDAEVAGAGSAGESAGELVIERLRRLNSSLNRQLHRQSDKIDQQTRENHRSVCCAANRDIGMTMC